MFERYRAARRRSASDIQSIFRNEVEIARRGTLDSFGADDEGDSKKEGELNATPRTRSNTISSDSIAGAESPEKCATPAGSSTMLSLKGWRSSGEREESHFTKNAGTVVRHSPESFTWTIPRLDLSERIGTTRFRVCSDADGCKEMRKGAEVAIEYAKDDKNETILKLYSMRDRLGFKMMIDDKEIVVNEEAAKTDRFQFAYEIRAPQLAEVSPQTPLNIKYLMLILRSRGFKVALRWHEDAFRREAVRTVLQSKFKQLRDKDTTRIPYYLKRTNSGNLPVYTDFRGGKPYTVVTHVRGNMESFVADLRSVLFGEREDPSLKNSSTERRVASAADGRPLKPRKEVKDPTKEAIVFGNKIRVLGLKEKAIKHWLMELGF
ncbi:hypothetical protein FOZ63_015143 [Perkinsus olseni]|uniref:Large ribosomal subunit protein mL49 n=1 Tax=Perkinsus olseni TaxID=32597 RepID=A0A7J6T548_PEROL|nr:hypothetical protein FOZ63_015143 [Perkinsus olseni]KAF4753470.1 hypothetical protein FOZ62_022528 [Perkinsus olseni]